MTEPTTIRTKRITELQQSLPLYGDELIPMLQQGVTKKASILDVNDYLNRQQPLSWVTANSGRQMQSASWVNSVSASTSRANTWVFSNSAVQKQTSDLVSLSANNWKIAYDFSQGIVSGGLGSALLGPDAVATINLQNGSVTPAKLSSGSPSWDSTTFTIKSSGVRINPSINSDTSIFLNDNLFNKNSNIIHKGTGELYITSQDAGGNLVLETKKDADIIFNTNNIERGSIDGETGIAKFNYGIEIGPLGTLTTNAINAGTINVSNLDISNIPQNRLKIKSGGKLEFLNSTPNTAFYLSLAGENRFNILNNLNGKSAFYIDENNNVGLETTTPSAKLHVVGGSLGAILGNKVELFRLTNTNSNSNNLRIYQLRFANGTAWTTAETRIQQTTDITDQTYISFSPDGLGGLAIGTGSPATEKFRINSLGNTTIYGTLSASNNASFGGSLSVTGDSTVNGSNTVTGDITTFSNINLENNKVIKFKNSTGSYNDILFLANTNITYLQGNGIYFRTLAGNNLGYFDSTGNLNTVGDVAAFSDEKLKKNVKTIENGLDKVKKLRGVEYERIDINKKGIGFIAQEIEKIIPDVVSETDGYKTVSYGNVVGLLVEAIKELSREIESLKNK